MNHIKLFFRKLNGTENYIMNREFQLRLKNAILGRDGEAGSGIEKALGQIRVRVSVSLVLVNFAISVMEY